MIFYFDIFWSLTANEMKIISCFRTYFFLITIRKYCGNDLYLDCEVTTLVFIELTLY